MASFDKQNFWQDAGSNVSFQGIPTLQDWVNYHTNASKKVFSKNTQFNEQWQDRQNLLRLAKNEHTEQYNETLNENLHTLSQDMKNLSQSVSKVANPLQLWQEYTSYLKDASTRYLQTMDILRERGDIFIEHEQAGCPPVLDYEYEILMDATTFDRPCNYVLLKILPPTGMSIDPNKRPYIIIDPRAGHGGGIGGFKHDSQVGVALSGGHAVYFVAFKRLPEPTQTIADICHAEAKFVRGVMELHPNSPAPVIMGNCQGGWAILLLAATHHEITGPIVLNGSPVSAWSGTVGIHPMRYKAGIDGGTWLSMLTADMGNGVFDGAWLVHNFEQMNPSRNYIGKYYDLYKNPTANRERFLEFERWWGGFFMMNEQEIRWIVENIFIGNRLARNTAQLEAGTNIDLKTIKAPIIIFASYGDNITPPPQAVSWIMDTYTDEREIELCGQRIVYMIHEHVGHLGIFVSSSIANREHKSIATLLGTIETMPPGLYELIIEDTQGEGDDMQFELNLAPRTFNDLAKISGDRQDEDIFRAVHRVSKTQVQGYEVLFRPVVKAMSNDITANWLRATHPMRLQRSLWSSRNPMATVTKNLNASIPASVTTQTPANLSTAESISTITSAKKQLAHMVGTDGSANLPAKSPNLEGNLFLQTEKLLMDNLFIGLDLWRDWHGYMQENLFFSIWSMPWLRNYGKPEASRLLSHPEALQQSTAVKQAKNSIDKGGLVEGVIRIMVLISKSTDGKIGGTEMAKFADVLTEPPFRELGKERITDIMHKQTLMVRFHENKALETLPTLLKNKADRVRAIDILNSISVKKSELPPLMQAMIGKITNVLATE